MKNSSSFIFTAALLWLAIFGGDSVVAPYALADDPAGQAEVNLESDYMTNDVLGAHRITLAGTLGGEMNLRLDGNVCQLKVNGDPAGCTLVFYRPIPVTSKKLEESGVPGGENKTLYELLGHNLQNTRLVLVVFPLPCARFRLIAEEKKGDQKSITVATLVQSTK